jgi:hypothetical protein
MTGPARGDNHRLPAGAIVLGRLGGGLYWLVPCVLAVLIFGLINVWLLLVEILR